MKLGVEALAEDLDYVLVLDNLCKAIPALAVSKNDSYESDSDEEEAELMETESNVSSCFFFTFSAD